MAVYRQIQISFWQDAFVIDLTPEEKYFYIYLMTNSKTSQCGIYELPLRVIEMETGYNRETVEKLLERFEGYGKILYSKATKEIVLLNWIKHNSIKSVKVMACVDKELKGVKNTEFIQIFKQLCIDYGYPIDSLSVDYGEEKEKEKEKEYINNYVEEPDESSTHSPGKSSLDQNSTEKDSKGNKNNKGNVKIKYDENSMYYKAAVYLRERILEFNPKCRVPNDTVKDLQKWANDMRIIFERDNRSREEVYEIIKYAFEENDFWNAVVQSPTGLRKNWDKIIGQRIAEEKKGNKTEPKKPVGGKNNRFHNFKQRTDKYSAEELEKKVRNRGRNPC
ncbi:hypothetical protein [Anaeromicrobium sediminis]|uniref:hypothetical protein n=1 Tax=Anaeromicrobium sediminis TaxID=1478221 RepID=UPI0015963985|nr:hypothetical protein [Anaeromicrobium sediminis]